MNRWQLIGWTGLLAACAAAAARAAVAPQHGIAALVNDAVITFDEVWQHALPGLELRMRTTPPEQYPQKRLETLTGTLEELIERQLVLDDFKAQGGQLPESMVEDEIKERIRRKYGDRAKLIQSLRAEGLTIEALRQQIRDDIILSYMRAKHVGHAVLISPAKIEQYYATNLAQFKVGDQVKLRLIVLNAAAGGPEETRRRAEEILVKIELGASFAEMAGVYSEGSQRREQGDLGWVDRTKLNRGLSDVAFALNPGQHSGVLGLAERNPKDFWFYRYHPQGGVTARHYLGKEEPAEEKRFEPPGWPSELPAPQEFYLLKVEDRRPARTLSLEEVREEIEKNLILQERARLQKRWVDRLKAKAFTRYF